MNASFTNSFGFIFSSAIGTFAEESSSNFQQSLSAVRDSIDKTIFLNKYLITLDLVNVLYFFGWDAIS